MTRKFCVTATDSARALIATLRETWRLDVPSVKKRDGSAPMCYPGGEFIIGDYDRLLGHIVHTVLHKRSRTEYWKHTQLIIDVSGSRWDVFARWP
jgi:uncharacterized protein (DUF779 family)